jgi:type II pantothenate kinase
MNDETPNRHHALEDDTLHISGLLPDGAAGIDVGLTLAKIARGTTDGVELLVRPTTDAPQHLRVLAQPDERAVAPFGVTGARVDRIDSQEAAVRLQEIEAAACGVRKLFEAEARVLADPFVLALLGTGTAFALVSSDRATHLGGTALGGGSFTGIARRIDPSLKYAEMVAGAERGERRHADLMVSDAYPEGIGRIGPDLTAAHLARIDGSIDDVLAALLNLHGETIGQIAASRARIGGAANVVLAGGFAHNNALLVASMSAMIGMFGITAEAAPSPGFAGAIGAAWMAAQKLSA